MISLQHEPFAEFSGSAGSWNRRLKALEKHLNLLKSNYRSETLLRPFLKYIACLLSRYLPYFQSKWS
jgi:hypothetical protein